MTDEQNGTDRANKPRESSEAEIQETKEELKKAIHGSHEVLATAKTVFPFALFPDTVTIDREKLTIARRSFFSNAEVMSIRIKDILNVTANVGPFFGSIHIVSRVLTSEKPYEVKFLWREDSLKLKRVMQGYIIATQKGIDCSPLTTEDLAELLNKLGKDDHP